jgi:hypothetical protein
MSDSNGPVLWGRDGKPVSLEGAMLAPGALNVAQIVQNIGKVYSYRWDEAMRDAPQNALAMRRDTFYLSLIQERCAPTINLEWQVEVENEDDPVQKLDGELLNRAWRELPGKPDLFTWLLQHTVWVGRAGQQAVWGRSESGLVNWLAHEPVHGDSIQYQWDRTPVVLVSNWTAQRMRAEDPDAVIPATDRGAFGIRLYKPEYRRRFVIHSHVREASDYFEGEMSGGIHGVGLRSWLYWGDYIRRDTLAAMLGFVNSVGMMDIVCFNFPMGDAAAEQRATDNAKKVSGKIAIVCPRDPQKDWPAVEQFPMNAAGVEVMQHLVQEYLDVHAERLVVGQSMSAGGGGKGGLEGDGRAEFARDTKFQLVKSDAIRIAETLTRDWLIPCRDYNRPGSRTPARLVPVLEDPDDQKRARNITVCLQAGIEIEVDEARRALGFKKPRPGKPTIGGRQRAEGGRAAT